MTDNKADGSDQAVCPHIYIPHAVCGEMAPQRHYTLTAPEYQLPKGVKYGKYYIAGIKDRSVLQFRVDGNL